MRLLGIFMLPFALLAALLPSAAQPAAAQDGGRIPSEFQVYLCPSNYMGTDYLVDCEVSGTGDFSITVTDTEVGNPTATTPTDADGSILFGTVPGPVTFALEVPGDFASFYYACFDGAGVFQFDGSSNVIETELAQGDEFSCRWYVIPDDANGPGPSASPSAPVVGTATVDLQVFVCPVAYAGDAYLTDCDPTQAPISVLLSPDIPFGVVADATETGSEGRAGFDELVAGDYSLALDVPGEFADFYVACFDVTSGAEEFLFDSDTNTVSFDMTDGSGLACRFYVIPEDLSGASASPSAPASVAPSVAPTASSRASGSAGTINVLPSTGTGSGAGSGSPLNSLMLGGLAILAVAAIAFTTRGLTSADR